MLFQISTFISSLPNGGAGAARMTDVKNIELSKVVRIRILRTISLKHTVYKFFLIMVEAEVNKDLYILIFSRERIIMTTKTS